jgi:hypothetical protein
MQLLSLPKLAAESGWPESRIRRMVARGQLSHIRVNGRVLLPETAIEEYVASHFVDAVGRSAPPTDLVLVNSAQRAERAL